MLPRYVLSALRFDGPRQVPRGFHRRPAPGRPRGASKPPPTLSIYECPLVVRQTPVN